MWMLYLYVSRTTYYLTLDKPHFLGSIVQRKVMFINNEQLKKMNTLVKKPPNFSSGELSNVRKQEQTYVIKC